MANATAVLLMLLNSGLDDVDAGVAKIDSLSVAVTPLLRRSSIKSFVFLLILRASP